MLTVFILDSVPHSCLRSTAREERLLQVRLQPIVAHFIINTKRNRMPLIVTTGCCQLKRTFSSLPVIYAAGRSGKVG